MCNKHCATHWDPSDSDNMNDGNSHLLNAYQHLVCQKLCLKFTYFSSLSMKKRHEMQI